jgi:hypothetical protein
MTLPNSSSINAYGSGVLVDAVPLVDPTSELGAAALNPLRNDVSAMTATSPRLIFQYLGTSGTPAVASSATWTAGNDSHWGNAFAVQPVMARTSTGIYTVQLPSTVSDQIGNNNLVNVRFAVANMINDAGGSPAVCICTVTSSSTFRIKQYFLNSGSWQLSDFSGILFAVTVF